MSELERGETATDRPEAGEQVETPAETPDTQIDTGGGDVNIDTGNDSDDGA